MEMALLNLALYSDQIITENEKVDLRLVDLMAARSAGRSIGYVPSGPDPDRRFFDSRKSYYARYGLDLTVFYDLDRAHAPQELAALLACDAIHLSGGHTRGFLDRLKRNKMLDVLRAWARSGGVLIGTSAGAILMTADIATDTLLRQVRPEEIRNQEALGLVPFEFFPHLQASTSYLPELLRYSRLTPRPIIGCHDGDGVIVRQGKVELLGSPTLIFDGAVIPADDRALAELEIGFIP
jgi:dipeptidase E